MQIDDDKLVERARQGDPTAFEALVQRYQIYVYNLALRVVNHPDEAADLTQQAFVRAWHGLPAFRAEAKFSTWLYRITTNLCLNRLPHLRRELLSLTAGEEALAEVPEPAAGPEDVLIQAAQRQQIQRAFAALPESYRLLISLRHLQELSYDEIAQATGLPIGTVKTGIFRARRLLRQALLEGESEYEC